MVCVVSSRSPSTLMVSLPAERALTDTTMVSPDWYSGLSMEVSRRSGVSALPSEYQPTSNCTEVIGPSASVDFTARRERPGGGGRGSPARWAVGFSRLDVEAVAAGLRRQRDPRRLVGGDRQVAVRNARGRFDRLIFPIG